MLIASFRKFSFASPCYIFLVGLVFFCSEIKAQETSTTTESSTSDLGNIGLPTPPSIAAKYSYNVESNLYFFSESIDGYPINTPLVLTPKEFEALVLKETRKLYFKEKISALSGKGANIEESQKNLLPELYVNNKFFQSIFGSNTIDIKPQGSIGIDLGVRYQKNDNPSASPRNRKNFGFDFDQRISLSLLGNIGERLQITANYDTESTFDFQNLVKLQFNPPKISDLANVTSGQLGSRLKNSTNKLDNISGGFTDVKQEVDQLKNNLEASKDKIEGLKNNLNALPNSRLEMKNKVSEYLKGNVTEDAILQNIDIGNVSMPINSNLIQGAQSLFGVRADLKFGKTTISAVFSEQRSQSNNITTQGGEALKDFDIFALDYEEDRHFFLAHYFRDNYDQFLENYPYINSPVQITRIEVWVTNRGSQTQNIRNIVALQDLGEANPENVKMDDLTNNFFTGSDIFSPPRNSVNGLDPDDINQGGILTDNIRDISSVSSGFGTLSSSVKEGRDYGVLESARKLSENEYRFHPQLGYVSLNQRLSNDEILGVAFQFTYLGEVYQVGEFANSDVPGTSLSTETSQQNPIVSNNSLIVKMLKSSLTDVRQPIWDLMMKNIYNIGAYQLSQDDFRMNILYTDPSPINYMPPVDQATWPENLEKQVLLNTFGLDRLNVYQDLEPRGDGFFDYIPGITVDPQYGRIIFPKVEPFGKFLFDLLDSPDSSNEDYEFETTYNNNQKKYVFREMYALTKAGTLEVSEKNKFQLKGRYKSEGGDGIPIGAFNVPRGSVRVTAGGRVLQEGLDYTVNYEIGRVKILDEGLKASNIPIDISVENNSFFNQQNKRFSGFNVLHQVNENLVFGGTLLNLSENPLTQKANYGTEPVNNTMVGFNTNFSTEIPFLTRLVNKLPTVETEVSSNLSFRGEVAALIARNPKNTQLEGESNVYIDDFEGAQTNIDVKGFAAWNLSSVPVKNGVDSNGLGLDIGYGRSKLAWYSIDPIFYTGQRPSGINNDDISSNNTRRIFIKEIFPEQDLVQGTTTVQTTFDLAYYPQEKGPYNNAPENQFLSSVSENWAGIMRPITSTNFEQSNVEFIEFWLLDTFTELDTPEQDLGSLVFHLGNISEDILRDGRKQFENGLPGANDLSPTYSTPWGKVPASQSLLYAFNTISEDRILQDVGLDGLSDEEEKLIYTNGPDEDPGGDNYQYFVSAQGNILDRYKYYNGTDGNAPIAFSDTDRGNTTVPDTEDINRDQSMNTIDSYFEYQVPIAKNMTIGNHPFVTDVRENVKVTAPNGEEITARWIQFKVPIQKNYYEGTSFEPYFESVNSIEDLRSVRFMRMVLSGFETPVVFRFGTLDLVRGDWRRYNKELNEEILPNKNTTVDISTVNILENESRIPINYVLPPGIEREQINNNNTIVRQNEQSLSFRICDLQPMDSRGIYKGVDLDMRQYSKIRMFLHAESIIGKPSLPGEGINEEFDRRMVAFIRLGTDYKDNYYQIEIPLKPSDYIENTSNNLSAEEVWLPDSNALEIPLDLLSKIKSLALNQMALGTVSYFDEDLNSINEFTPISSLPGSKKYKLSIKGNPSLGSIKTLMIGLKNPSVQMGDALCGEVWFNELRISGIDNRGGWSAIASMDANIADFATFSATGRYSTVGFGSIDQNANQRSREEMLQYDVVSNVNIGQLVPKKWGIQIPLNFAVGETTITPEYDPFYQDLRLKDRLSTATRKSQRDSIRQQALDYTKRKSISLIGVRKNKLSGNESRFYSPENFDFSYAYNELYHQDYEVEKQQESNLMIGGNYGHSFKPLEINPFKKVELFNSAKYWQWLKELNFNLMPNSIQLATNINRTFNRQRFREIYLEGVDASQQLALPELQQQNFLFDWTYSINHNLTRSLRLNFTSSTNNIIRKERFSNENQELESDVRGKGIWEDIWNTGEPNRHFQSLSLNYKFPFRFIPVLSFIDANYNYTGDFNWQRGAEAMADVVSEEGIPLGIVNTVQNANTQTLTGAVSFDKLYSIFGLQSKKRGGSRPNQNNNKKDSTSKAKNKFLKKSLTGMVNLLSAMKRVQLNYSENNGTVLPGYLPSVGFAGGMQPSLGFTFGSQADIRYEAARQGWLTGFPNFNQPITQVHNNNLKVVAQLAPSKGLIIDLNLDRSFSRNKTENFSVLGNSYVGQNTNVYGNFATSIMMIKTAFKPNNGAINSNFEKFRAYRYTIANRLAAANDIGPQDIDQDGFPNGFGKNQQQVLVNSFLAAFTGKNPETINLNPIRTAPLPNWDIKFTGLMGLKPIKKVFDRFTLSHGYRSSFTINNFQTNFDYDVSNPQQTDNLGNIIPYRLFSNINLIEQFNPLIRIDLEFKNSIKVLAEIRSERALSLSLDNDLLTESSGDEFSLGLGYRLKDLRFKTNFGGRRVTLKGDLNLKADVSYRNNITVLRNLEYDNNQVTAGQKIMSIKFTADYALSKNLTSLFFYDHNFSEFAVSTAFPQTSIRSGFTVRYNFGN